MNNGKGEGQRCSRAQCECDRELSLQLAEMEIAWSPMFQSGKYGLFDRPSTCAVQERAAVENEVIEPRCCGYYPKVMFQENIYSHILMTTKHVFINIENIFIIEMKLLNYFYT